VNTSLRGYKKHRTRREDRASNKCGHVGEPVRLEYWIVALTCRFTGAAGWVMLRMVQCMSDLPLTWRLLWWSAGWEQAVEVVFQRCGEVFGGDVPGCTQGVEREAVD
jgi:hypothetical protein